MIKKQHGITKQQLQLKACSVQHSSYDANIINKKRSRISWYVCPHFVAWQQHKNLARFKINSFTRLYCEIIGVYRTTSMR
jgi:hypothetical protein